MTGRRTTIAIVVAAVLVGGGVAAALAVPDTGDDVAAQSDLPPETAEVVRETLVDTQTESGELGHGEDTTVTGRIGGTVTALPLAGAVIDRGQAVYHVDDTPVVLLFGSLPAYRALAVDTEGTDVRQFEENLSALGYGGFTVDEEYSDATADAVEAWQEDLGLQETGTVDLGRVVYAPGAVRVATLTAAVGDATQPGGSVLTHTGTTRVVTVELEVSDQRLAVTDAAVGITLPDGRGGTGKITGTQTVIETSETSGSDGVGGEGDSTETKLEVTVTPDDPAAFDGLDRATVDIGFTATTRENVLTVPVAALLALAEGGYGVEVVEGRTSRIVAVETGLFAGGRVEVSGTGLSEGQNVGMPS